jgi:hypothetical protein
MYTGHLVQNLPNDRGVTQHAVVAFIAECDVYIQPLIDF